MDPPDDYEDTDVDVEDQAQELCEQIILHVIGLPADKLQFFLMHVPIVGMLKNLATEEMSEMWQLPGLSATSLSVRAHLRTYKMWLMRTQEDNLNFDADMLKRELSLRVHQSVKDNGATSSRSNPKIDWPTPFNGIAEKWKRWKRSVWTYFTLLKNPQGLPYAYVLDGITRKGNIDIDEIHTPTSDPANPMHEFSNMMRCKGST